MELPRPPQGEYAYIGNDILDATWGRSDMKLLVEFTLKTSDDAHDVAQLCVDIRDRINGYLISRQLSWDEVRVSELHSHAIVSLYEELRLL